MEPVWEGRDRITMGAHRVGTWGFGVEGWGNGMEVGFVGLGVW